MYSILLPTGEWLDGVPDLGFELNNAVFSSSDTSTLPGQFSFPFDLPATGKNVVALKFPAEINHTANPKTVAGVYAYLYGIAIFYGDLTVRSATPKKITCNFVANFLTKVKDTPLSELDLGGDRTVPGGAGNWAAHMAAVAADPDAHDYNFVPVHVIKEGAPDSWVNKCAYGPIFDTASLAISPMVKCKYLLDRIFAQSEFHFQNDLQSAKEPARLVQYDHHDVRVAGANPADAPVLPAVFNLQNHVPNLKSGEYLKRLAAMYNLGFFSNIWEKTVRLIPLATVLRRPTKHDWTAFASLDFLVEKETRSPGLFGFSKWAISEGLDDRYRTAIEQAAHFNTVADWVNASFTFGNGWIYIESTQFFGYFYSGAFAPGLNYQVNKWVRTGPEAEEYLLEVEHFGLQDFSANGYCPETSVQPAFWENSGTGTEYKKNKSDSPFEVLLNRGLSLGTTGIPRAYYHVWDPFDENGVRSNITGGGAPTETSQISLNWPGDYGLFKTYHEPWHNMLRYGKEVEMSFHLPVSELIQFSFEDKTRIGSMDFFVKKLRVGKPLGKGKVAVEASLVSVI